MPVTLQNVSRRMLTFNLTHACVTPEMVSVVEKVERATTDRHGRTGLGIVRLTHPPVLTLLVGATSQELPMHVMKVETVRRAIDDGSLRVIAMDADVVLDAAKKESPARPRARASSES